MLVKELSATMLDKSILGGSWESVISRDDYEIDYSPSPRGSPLKDTSNIQDDQPYLISRHNPNKTFRRESVIASWKNLKKEREQALGKRIIYVDPDNYEDYYGRNKVKRCKSERTASTPRILKKVKRTYSVLYRYDPNEEKVVKEYKYQPTKEPEPTMNSMQKSFSEPFLGPERIPKKKVKRSITTLLNIKTKILNIFSPKS
ncbi:uncharacterized protein LOC120634433 [Pararge aegeria]|uniref:Jg4071 protein n=1 Tax=Pararge aegeria aegeria TaxID=348720 RepID=A0A8S4RRI8_9NEOP|nr:uncharacterized protein LOC120634433 [Pararge aegeria]CAH2241000.1 jg4071 [Pararge aegeria aegeria]